MEVRSDLGPRPHSTKGSHHGLGWKNVNRSITCGTLIVKRLRPGQIFRRLSYSHTVWQTKGPLGRQERDSRRRKSATSQTTRISSTRHPAPTSLSDRKGVRLLSEQSLGLSLHSPPYRKARRVQTETRSVTHRLFFLV